MNLTSVGAKSTPVVETGAPASGDQGAQNGLFASLMAAFLGTPAGTPAGTPGGSPVPGTAAAGAAAADPAPGSAADATGSDGSAANLAMVAGLVVPGITIPGGVVTAATPAASVGQPAPLAPTLALGGGTAPGTGAASAPPGQTLTAGAPTLGASEAVAGTATASGPAPGLVTDAARASGSVDPAAAAGDPAATPEAAPSPAGPTPARSAQSTSPAAHDHVDTTAVAPSDPTSAVTGATPATHTGVQVAATASAPAAAPASAGTVTGQVYDAIERLLTRGDGTHRVTLKLNPGELGEVKIILTTRNGEVNVQMHAHTEATAALRAGAPELFRLLEGTPGTNSTHISVQDTTAGPAGFDLSGDQAARRQQPEPDQATYAGKRTGSTTTARDGVTGTATSDTGPIEHTAKTPLRGFDVTV